MDGEKKDDQLPIKKNPLRGVCSEGDEKARRMVKKESVKDREWEQLCRDTVSSNEKECCVRRFKCDRKATRTRR